MNLCRFALVLLTLPAELLLSSCGVAMPSSGCGSAQVVTPSTCSGRCLTSITVCPATADPRMTNGQVQFTATGNYSTAPFMVTPQAAVWGVCMSDTPTNKVMVSSSGLAQCQKGASGTYTVFAYDMANCNALTACGQGCTIRGTAQLTCP